MPRRRRKKKQGRPSDGGNDRGSIGDTLFCLLQSKSALLAHLVMCHSAQHFHPWSAHYSIQAEMEWDRLAIPRALGIPDKTIEGSAFFIWEKNGGMVYSRTRSALFMDALIWWSKAHDNEREGWQPILDKYYYPERWQGLVDKWRDERHSHAHTRGDVLAQAGLPGIRAYTVADTVEFSGLLVASLTVLLGMAMLPPPTHLVDTIDIAAYRLSHFLIKEWPDIEWPQIVVDRAKAEETIDGTTEEEAGPTC